MTSPSRPPADLRAEVGELRTQVENLATELEELRDHAATLEALALEDALTGPLNRRGFMRDLTRAVAYRKRYGTPVALMVVDLDRFKPINDTYGHDAGDRALRHIADLLRRNVRASDSVGRLGGDEFALIIWQAEPAAVLGKAQSLQKTIASAAFDAGGTILALSSSIGVTMLEPDDTPEEALMRADQAMYRQKAERRAQRG